MSVLESTRTANLDVSATAHAARRVDGWQLTAYAWPAASNALPVVFVNGMEERWDFCARVASGLHPGCRPFSLELPWSGREGHRWGTRVSGAEWIRAGLELLAIDRPVVVAHSFGANALLSFLDQYGAGAIRAAILVSPFYKRRAEDFDWTLLRHYVDQFQLLLQTGLEARPETARLSPDFRSAMAARLRDRIGPYGWLQFFDLFSRTPDLSLDRVDIPCLVIGGETDFASWPDDCTALGAALPAGAARILPGCGHFCMSQRPDAVAAAIETFLAEHFNEFTEECQR